MIKFPYGICDFYKMITEGYFYVDRTDRIPYIEEAGQHLVFLRPRRFGKSLLLSMLENYYDVAKADEFEKLFGHLAIGNNPTPKRNQYFVLKLDFSSVSPEGGAREIQQKMYNHINGCIEQFIGHYKDLLDYDFFVDPNDAVRSLHSVLAAIETTPYKLYLLIDEYDNFANEVLMGGQTMSTQRYEALLYGEGALKAFFKAVKAASAGRGLDQVFTTGVAPIVLTDLRSGYNVAKGLYLKPQYHDLCGFWESEIQAVLQQIVTECNLAAEKADEALTMMRTFYDGYCFHPRKNVFVYNPTLALYFMENFQESCHYPENILDSNLGMDQRKLTYVSQIPNGRKVIVDALNETQPVSVQWLAHRFGVEDLLYAQKDTDFMASLLYYLGVLTLNGRDEYGELLLKVPNLVSRKLYVERIQEMLLPEEHDKNLGQQAAKIFYRTGDMHPLCDFIEHHYFKVFDNRDYRWTNELTIKTIFLTLLFNDLLYIMDSETALERRYSDLIMLVRPDMRQYQLLDFLIEFKYISITDVNVTGEKARQLSIEEIRTLKQVRQKFHEARTALESYRKVLTTKYGELLRLHTYSVVSVGFDRLVWEEVSA